jgi:hypothetical protein
MTRILNGSTHTIWWQWKCVHFKSEKPLTKLILPANEPIRFFIANGALAIPDSGYCLRRYISIFIWFFCSSNSAYVKANSACSKLIIYLMLIVLLLGRSAAFEMANSDQVCQSFLRQANSAYNQANSAYEQANSAYSLLCRFFR